MHPVCRPAGRHGAEPADGVRAGYGGVQAGCCGSAGGVAVSAAGVDCPVWPAAMHCGVHRTRLLSRYMFTFDRRDGAMYSKAVDHVEFDRVYTEMEVK